MWWQAIIEIGTLWFVIYHVLVFFEGTRAIQVLRGIIIILVSFLLSQILGLEVLNWLLAKLFGISIIAILVIFHPEIRQGLARLGQRHLFSTTLNEEEEGLVLEQVVKAAEHLCNEKIGALIAVERNDPLTAYIENGVAIDAYISTDLIESIFNPSMGNPLHDGGLIIRQKRAAAAGCLFPLTQNTELSRIYGTRHRAALGLSEETDAIVIVVSEERKDISLVHRGRLHRDLSPLELLAKAKEIIKAHKKYA